MKKIMRKLARIAVLITLFIRGDNIPISTASTLPEQLEARLEVKLSKSRIRLDEPLQFLMLVGNVGTVPWYISGNVNLNLGNVFGEYRIEFKKEGEQDYSTRYPRAVADYYPRTYVSLPTFVFEHNLVLLQPGGVIGRNVSTAWKELSDQPGKYKVRIAYSAKKDPIMELLRHPFLATNLTSNETDLEVVP